MSQQFSQTSYLVTGSVLRTLARAILLAILTCAGTQTATSEQSVDFTYSSDGAAINITGYTGSVGVVNIPGTINALPVGNICRGAFKNLTNLTCVTIPGSVTSIEYAAFYGCSGLTNVTIGTNVTNIGGLAFEACQSLTNVMIPSSVRIIGISAFSRCTNLANVTIPEGVVSVGDLAFMDCSGLTSVTFPNSVTNIGSRTFWRCRNLTSVTLSEQVTTISDRIFEFCPSLTKVTLGRNITNIESSAFSMCKSLSNITIPSSVKHIGKSTFGFCANMRSIYFRGDAPDIGENAFYRNDWATVYYLPGTKGWGKEFGGRPTALWNVAAQTNALLGSTKTVESTPPESHTYLKQGRALAKRGKYEEAIINFTKAIELDPTFAAAYVNRGVSRQLLGLSRKSVDDFGKAIELNPKDANSYFYRGLVLVQLDEQAKALADYTKAVELNPQHPEAKKYRDAALKKIRNGTAFAEMLAALGQKDLEKLERLLKNSPEAVFIKDDSRGSTLLHNAAMASYRPGVELLLARGARVDIMDQYGDTPLHSAAERGDQDVVELLLTHKVDVNTKNKRGETPLQIAAGGHFTTNGYKNVTQLFLEKGANVTLKDNDGMTALHKAALFKNEDVVEWLLTNNVEVDARSKYGVTPLHLARTKGIAAMLLAHKADITLVNNDGWTCLHYAVSSGERDLLTFLLSQRCNVNAKDKDGRSPLHVVMRRGRKDVAESLLSHKADVNAKTLDGATPLHDAVEYRRKDMVEFLLANGANVNAKNNDGATPLHLAVSGADQLILLCLLAHKGDVNAKNNDGATPLHLAATTGEKDVVELLLANRADLNLKDNNGLTPLQCATKKNMAEVFFSQMTDFNADGVIPLNARIPRSKHLNPIAIHNAQGITNVPNADIVDRLLDKYEVFPNSFRGLHLAYPTDTLVAVRLSRQSSGFLPPDMGGVGPFHLVKRGDDYFVLTERNFALLFSPVTETNLLAYVTTYEKLYKNPFAEVIMEDFDKKKFKDKRTPPKVTSFTREGSGFRIDMILYNKVHSEEFYQKSLLVERNGRVTLQDVKVLKELGGGIVF
jgi:cytohesin